MAYLWYYYNFKAGNGLATESFENAPSSESHRSSMMIGRTAAAWLKTETRFGAQPAARSKTQDPHDPGSRSPL
jgi:hypothetical protein